MLACIFTENRNNTPLYDGPYKVIVRNGRVMKILIKGKVETVLVDRVKPAHFECQPEIGTATKRKTQSRMTNSTGIRKDHVRSSSTLTQKSDRTRVKLTKNTQWLWWPMNSWKSPLRDPVLPPEN